MDPRLHQVIEYDDVDELHKLIVEDQKFLDRVSEEPFPNTPLHIAAAAGKIQVAMEVAILKPSFSRKLDPEGYSPMHLALQHKHYHTVRALMTLDPKLIRVRGRCGITPLHFVAGKEGDDELELLAEFLSTCRSSIEDLTSRCETAVHIAVKKHNLKAFKLLFGWLKRVRLTQILNWKDQDGNTVLHIAISEEQPEIIKLLIGYTDVNAKNFQNRTALDIFRVNVHFDEDVVKRLCLRSTFTLSLSQFFSMELTLFEKYLYIFGIQNEATRNIILVVATLIATATYQAVLSPPGGYWQDSSSNSTIVAANSSFVTANSSGIALGKPHQAGNLIMTGLNLYLFAYLNSAAFYVSVASIGVSAFSLWPHTRIVYSSLIILSCAYFNFLSIGFPESFSVIGLFPLTLLLCSLFAVLGLPWLLWRVHIGVVSRVDATRRRASDIPGLKE